MNPLQILDHVGDLTTVRAAFILSLCALAVVWKALDVVGRSQGKKPRGRD